MVRGEPHCYNHLKRLVISSKLNTVALATNKLTYWDIRKEYLRKKSVHKPMGY